MATQTFTFTGVAGDGNTIQIDLQFEATGSGVISTDGIGFRDLGTIRWKYDIDDLLLVPGTVDVTFIDIDGNLEPWFTNVGLPGTIVSDQNAKLTITYNSNVEYIGYMILETLTIYSNCLIKFKVSPRIDALNNWMVYDKTGTSNMGGAAFGYADGTWENIVGVIEDIYQIVNSGITVASGKLVIDHDWVFAGLRDPDLHVENSIPFEDIEEHTNYLFFDSTQGIESLGDVLRKYSADWCAFTGMIHEEKAFFRKFYYYDAANTQVLTNVLKHNKTYFNPVTYVDITDINSQNYTQGTYTTMAGKYITRTTFVGFDAGSSNMVANYGGDDYWIHFAVDALVNGGTQTTYAELACKFWYYARGNIARSRIDEFECYGLNYDFLKSTTYDSKKYQIIEMEKNYLNCITKIKALYMGAV